MKKYIFLDDVGIEKDAENIFPPLKSWKKDLTYKQIILLSRTAQ